MDIFKQNYKAVQDRGLINNNTTDLDFLAKLKEETREVESALAFNSNLNEELADVINVCTNWLIFRGINPLEELQKTLQKNVKRSKKQNYDNKIS